MMRNGLALLERYGLVIITALIIAFFSSYAETRDTFLTEANWRSILGSMSIQLLLSAAFTLPLVTGKIDLSPGAVTVMCSMIFAGLIGTVEVPFTGALGLPWIVAGLVVVAIGAALGAFSGLLVRLGADSLIATLSVGIVLGGLVSGYANGRSIVAGMPEDLLGLGRQSIGPLPVVFLAAVAIAGSVGFLLERTAFGRQLHAIGVNPAAARLVGIQVERAIFLSFVLSGAIAGLTAIVATARQGGGVPVNGLNLVLPALAGTYLGATTIRPGEYNIPGTLVGLLFVGTTVSGLTLMGVAAWVQPVFTGLALVCAVLIAHGLQKLAVESRL